jgi:hypothetical protein
LDADPPAQGVKIARRITPELAISSRARLIERAAADRIKLLGYHWTYPGVGFAERNGMGSYRYVPA